MRIITTPKQVIVTEYGCDECCFVGSREQVVAHAAKNHAAKKETNVAGKTLRYFEYKSEAENWMEAQGQRIREIEWTGSGWYLTNTWSQDCPRGCCVDSCIKLLSVEAYRQEVIDHARQIMWPLSQLKAYIKKE